MYYMQVTNQNWEGQYRLTHEKKLYRITKSYKRSALTNDVLALQYLQSQVFLEGLFLVWKTSCPVPTKKLEGLL